MALKDDPADNGSGTGRGLFDCDEAHRSPLKDDYERLFQSGMIVLDTNVLLNLYRSNARTREDTLAVLTKLRDRLWVPYQVLTEFWRNRELRSVRHHHSTKAKETSAALEKARKSASDAVERWVRDVRLKQDEEVTRQIAGGLEDLTEALGGLRALIDEQAERDALSGTGETHADPVLRELEPLLHRRVGQPLSEAEYDRAVQAAQKRADEEIPPGYEDFRNKPPEQAAGDYLLWLQLMNEARVRKRDVLLVTGDVKKDWWHPRDGDIPARPRAELTVELREAAGVRLYMLTPAELLTWADALLEGLQLDKDSVDDLEQLGGVDSEDETEEAGWTVESLRAFMGALAPRYPAHAKVIAAAVAGGGFVERATVYDLAGYSKDRQLKGFTRPISTVARELADAGVLQGEEPFLLHTIYGSVEEPSLASGFRVPEEAVPLLREALEDGPSRSQSGRGEADTVAATRKQESGEP